MCCCSEDYCLIDFFVSFCERKLLRSSTLAPLDLPLEIINSSIPLFLVLFILPLPLHSHIFPHLPLCFHTPFVPHTSQFPLTSLGPSPPLLPSQYPCLSIPFPSPVPYSYYLSFPMSLGLTLALVSSSSPLPQLPSLPLGSVPGASRPRLMGCNVGTWLISHWFFLSLARGSILL